MIKNIKNGLVVSCQALPHEPLHGSLMMGKMAKAAAEGGAKGIRANTATDINEIAKNTTLPIIGIVKRDYDDSPLYITATMREIEELAATPCSMVAVDATMRKRPHDETLTAFVAAIRNVIPNKELMADISTVEEAINAEKLGFDCVSTTLVGYTSSSEGQNICDNDYALLKKIVEAVQIPVIAEGQINTPQKAKACLKAGAHCVVVGAAITRPQLITKAFVECIDESE